MNTDFELIKQDLENLDSKLFACGKEIYDRNIRFGFPHELSKLGLFLPFILSENTDIKHAVETILTKYVKNANEKIQSINIIKEIEQLNDDSIKKAYERNPNKMYDVIFTKIIYIDVALALMSLKVTELNSNVFLPDKNTFLNFVEKVYSIMSQIFGISNYTALFDDFVITNKHPEEYKKTIQLTKENLTRSKEEIKEIISTLTKYKKHPNEIILGRLKTPASVFRKVYVRQVKPEDILDFVAIRIITNTIADCYSWLGTIYELWPPRLSTFKDYIEHPKPNGYKSLHVVVDTEYGPVEIQIRTHTMHKFAECGLAAHWKYKTNSTNKIQDKIKSALTAQKPDFGQGYIFVFTPKKDVVLLDTNSCIVDFAYAIHTDLGNHISQGEINGKLCPLNTKLKDKDVVKIHTDPKKKPNKKWLEFVVTKRAKEKICQALNTVRKDKNNKFF